LTVYQALKLANNKVKSLSPTLKYSEIIAARRQSDKKKLAETIQDKNGHYR